MLAEVEGVGGWAGGHAGRASALSRRNVSRHGRDPGENESSGPAEDRRLGSPDVTPAL